jgi:hypothetical protein
MVSSVGITMSADAAALHGVLDLHEIGRGGHQVDEQLAELELVLQRPLDGGDAGVLLLALEENVTVPLVAALLDLALELEVQPRVVLLQLVVVDGVFERLRHGEGDGLELRPLRHRVEHIPGCDVRDHVRLELAEVLHDHRRATHGPAVVGLLAVVVDGLRQWADGGLEELHPRLRGDLALLVPSLR